jgi:hypothetical protein
MSQIICDRGTLDPFPHYSSKSLSISGLLLYSISLTWTRKLSKETETYLQCLSLDTVYTLALIITTLQSREATQRTGTEPTLPAENLLQE